MPPCAQEGIVKLAVENFSVSLVKGRQLLLRLSQYLILDQSFTLSASMVKAAE